jgi:hypothetical protein
MRVTRHYTSGDGMYQITKLPQTVVDARLGRLDRLVQGIGTKEFMHDFWEWREAIVKNMLGQWVSGLEPCLLIGADGGIIGLTIVGIPLGVVAPVVVRA